MYSFANDYSEGGHERILEELTRTAREQTGCYGIDSYCDAARASIQQYMKHPESDIHFLVGGTQTNMIACAALLHPWEGVVSARTGHVNVHEAGAIEATGHKVLPVECGIDGKLTARSVDEWFTAFFADETAEHMVQPGMVYISHPTENGTLYTKAELTALKKVCEKWKVPLYMDGARLACALEAGDITLSDCADLTDLFYIGGTKMGALFGEAMVINNPRYKEHFRTLTKQRGGMLAKGKLLGIQFDQLFRDGLYFELGRHANTQAMRLAEGIRALGYEFLVETPANQIFPIFPRRVLEKLSENWGYSFWCRVDDTRDAVRLCTSWATRPDMVEAFLEELKRCRTGQARG